MIRCNNCGTNNLDGSEYCDECGMRLEMNLSPPPPPRRDYANGSAYQPPSAVRQDAPAQKNQPSQTQDVFLPSPPSFTTSTSMPKPAMPARDANAPNRRDDSSGNYTSQGNGSVFIKNPLPEPPRQEVFDESLAPPNQPPQQNRTNVARVESSSANSSAEALARLVIERGGRIGKEFVITGVETSIGRWDADSGIFPDVDLDEDDPEAKISRRHARIIRQSGQFLIEDLGSTNGTFVNRGRRLLPGKRHALQHGDEVIVGKTFLKFHVLK